MRYPWILLIAASLLLGLACGRNTSQRLPGTSDQQKATSKNSQNKAKQQPADKSHSADTADRLRTIRTPVDVNPDQKTSTTESLHLRIQKQLKSLTKFKQSQFGKLETSLFKTGFIAKLPTSNALKPIDSHDTSFQIQRLSGDSEKANGNAFSFLKFLTDSISNESRLKFKVFGIVETTDSVASTIRLRTASRADRELVQQTIILNAVWTKDAQPKLLSMDVQELERVTLASVDPIFQDCTEAILANNDSYKNQLVYGLDHWLDRLELYHGIVATSYHGLSIADVNGDGLDDLYTCQPGGVVTGLPNRLFLQNKDGTARDFSEASGLNWLTETHCALFVDFDNDGDQDIVASTMSGLVFCENDGSGRFKPKTFKLIPDAPPIALAAADFDNDGDIDVYCCSYGRRASSQIMGRPLPYHDANNGSPNALFRNDRKFRFQNVTKSVGLDHNNHRFSLACSWEDFDNDGDQDLYVANDFGRNNLYRNDGDKFSDVAAEWNVEDMSAGMSVSWADCDNNSKMDLYVSNMWSSAGNRIAYQRDFLRGNEDQSVRSKFQRHARGNSLFLNSNDRFTDISEASRTTMAGWAWSSTFADLNNDGWQDLIVANGYITQENQHDL